MIRVIVNPKLIRRFRRKKTKTEVYNAFFNFEQPEERYAQVA